MTAERAAQIKAAWAKARDYAIRNSGFFLGTVGVTVEIGRPRFPHPFVSPDPRVTPIVTDLVTFRLEWRDLPLPNGQKVWRIVGDGVEVETGVTR